MGFLIETISAVTPQQIVMWIVGGLLIFLAIKKEMEPALLLPMGFGAIIINIPFSGAEEIMSNLFAVGITAGEAMPLLLFIGIGAMIDFTPLIQNPKLFIFGGAAQFGIFATIFLASLFFDLDVAATIGIIGAADGPTTIKVANTLIPSSPYFGAITVVAYSYMALVPVIQPIVIKAVTTKRERLIRMDYVQKPVSTKVKILFPIVVTIISGLIVPESLSLVGMLMFGNLIRVCGVLDSLSETAQKTLANLITLLLGITIAFSMKAANFVRLETLAILGLGLFAFVFDTVAGVMVAKFINIFSKNKINPMVGAAGISAFPMSARVIQKMGLKEDPTNHLLMHAVGANVAGQVSSAVVGGLILAILPGMLG